MSRQREEYDRQRAASRLDPQRNGAGSESSTDSISSSIIRSYVSTNGVDHPQRLQLLRIIQDQPGLNIRELTRRMGLSRSATRYHLRKLMKLDKVVTRRQGHHVLHFASTMPSNQRKAVCLLRIGSVRSLVEIVAEEGSVVRVSELAKRLGISRRSARRSIKMLTNEDLAEVRSVEGERGARKVTLHPDTRVAWVLWCQQTGSDDEYDSLHKAPGWMLWFDMAFGFLFASWYS